MSSARNNLKQKAQLYYEAGAKRVRNITYGVLVLLTIILVPVLLTVWGFVAMFSVIILNLLLFYMTKFMIKKNPKGNVAFSELKGFKQFIKVAEINKLKMLITENPSYFETTMGYALAFGLFDKWASKFDALHVPPPNWYSSSSNRALTMHSFSNSFANSMSSAKTTMVSSPKSSGSSGGGSSGGGFGGGGGGSW